MFEANKGDIAADLICKSPIVLIMKQMLTLLDLGMRADFAVRSFIQQRPNALYLRLFKG